MRYRKNAGSLVLHLSTFPNNSSKLGQPAEWARSIEKMFMAGLPIAELHDSLSGAAIYVREDHVTSSAHVVLKILKKCININIDDGGRMRQNETNRSRRVNLKQGGILKLQSESQ